LRKSEFAKLEIPQVRGCHCHSTHDACSWRPSCVTRIDVKLIHYRMRDIPRISTDETERERWRIEWRQQQLCQHRLDCNSKCVVL